MTRLIGLDSVFHLVGLAPAAAHHSLSIYDRNQSKTVEGVVKEFRFANPHARILLLVAAEDGTMKEWDFEGGGVRRLTERGISVNTIAKGDKITVSYNPMRDGSARGLFVELHDARMARIMSRGVSAGLSLQLRLRLASARMPGSRASFARALRPHRLEDDRGCGEGLHLCQPARDAHHRRHQ